MGPKVLDLQYVLPDLSDIDVVLPQREYVYDEDDDLRVFVDAYRWRSTVLEIANYL